MALASLLARRVDDARKVEDTVPMEKPSANRTPQSRITKSIRKEPENFSREQLAYRANALPLPHLVDVSFGGTEEIRDLFEEQSMRANDIGSNELRATTGPFVKHVLWAAILKRISLLSQLHSTRTKHESVTERSRHSQKPLPLNISNILGFDLTFTLRYEGKKMIELINQKAKIGKMRENELLKRTVGLRLMGGILLWLASELASNGHSEIHKIRRLIPLLRDSELLGKDDAHMISKALPKSSLVFMDSAGEMDRMKVALLTVAYQYLHKGGVLQLHDNITPESLARDVASSSI